MNKLGGFWRRVRMLFQRDRFDRDLDQEMRLHRELREREERETGSAVDEARYATQRRFGNELQIREQSREMWGWTLFAQFVRDVRLGGRALRKNPWFTAIAVLTLALGIGANTAIFSALNTLLLRPIPVENADRLTYIVSLREGFDPFGTSYLEYAAYRDRSNSFVRSGIAVPRSFSLIGRGEPERIQGAAILASYLKTLGVQPVIGRNFTPEEDKPGGPAVALVGYGLWQRRFGGDPQLVGRTLNLEGRSTTIIGILPAQFDVPDAAEIWVPLQIDIDAAPLAVRAAPVCEVVARLKPGVRLQQADRELKGIAAQLEREYPQFRSGWSVRAVYLRDEILGDVTGQLKRSLLAFFAAVGFVWFICCANVASLLLARSVTREREIALRRALGATWSRIIRQLMAECLVLAMLGGAVGLLLAQLIVPLLRSLNPIQTAGLAGILGDIRIDGRALSFAACITLFTAVACALIPVVKTRLSNDMGPLIQEGGQRGNTGSRGRRWLGALVVAEIAIAVPLLAGGGLLIQSFQRLQHIEFGFRPDNLLTIHLDLPSFKYPEFQQRVTFVKRVLERVKSLPGVVSVGTTTNMPLTQFISYHAVFTVEGRPKVNPSDVPITAHRLVSPEYLQTLGVTLVEGRLINERDRANSMPVVVISEEFARQSWPGADPLGKRAKRVREGQTFPWLTVVGVIKDIKEDRFNFRINRPAWYLPFEQYENSLPLDLVVRAERNPSSLAGPISDAVHSVDPDQPVSNAITMKEQIAGVLVTDRFSAILMGTLAGLGLLLAIIGLYGVMAYAVSRQTREIGLRVALGASPTNIMKMVAGRGARIVATGLFLGLIGAFSLTRFLTDSLYQVSPNDPFTFITVSVILVAVAMAACYVPARRATKVDPIVALRYE